MEVQILEFDYRSDAVENIESRINNYVAHNDVSDVQVTQSDNRLLVFCFCES